MILEARNICKSYWIGRQQTHVLQGVSLKVKRGEFLAIMGASGSGKSTLLHIFGLLDRPDQGEAIFEGDTFFKLRKSRQDRIRNLDVGFVFQFYHLLPELNVQENILLPLMVGSSIWQWPGRRRAAQQRARELLESVGLIQQRKQRPSTLSGGERQRVAIARALVQKPKLLLADEPTGNLDSAAGNAILELLARLNQAGQTIVMVTHDANVAGLADRTVMLRDGKIHGE
ncbi:MAG: ABC transporter ATP-binding protein [Planctomycetes bacterium]|nr:ABC transporter ATP-binding protein [Planctomycetota bacterium]